MNKILYNPLNVVEIGSRKQAKIKVLLCRGSSTSVPEGNHCALCKEK